MKHFSSAALALRSRVASMLAMTAIGSASAQQAGGSLTLIDRVVSRATQLQSGGDYQGARRLLLDQLEICADGPRGSACRGRINYGLGYVAQRQAAISDSVRDTLFAHSVSAYLAVLGDYPAHADALRNIWLVYSNSAPAKLDTSGVRTAMRADPARRAGYLRLLGDHYLALRDSTAARNAYRQAIGVAPDDPEPRYQLLRAYDKLDAVNANTVFTQLSALEASSPESALDGYRWLLLSQSASADVQERALVSFVSLASRENIVPESVFVRLPKAIRDSRPGGELQSYLLFPWLIKDVPDNWWMGNDARRSALGRLTVPLGNEMLAKGRPADAVKCWTTALRFVRADDAAALDLQRSLAVLYYGHPELDPGGQGFRDIERQMFISKGVFISQHDSLLQQRYHAVLGIIYAQRGQWRSNSYAHDAIYQLEAALQIAADRDRSAHSYQPLPKLHELLAAGYSITHDGRERGEVTRAIEEYLDIDDLTHSDSLLHQAGVVPTLPIAALRSLVRRRLQMSRQDSATGPGPACSAPLDTLTGFSATEASFASRQRFKLFADCAALLRGAAHVRAAARALSIVGTREGFVVASPADLLRLEQVRRAVSDQIGMPFPRVTVRPGVTREGTDSLHFGVAVALGDEPSFVQLRAEERLAAKLAEGLAELGPGLRLYITGNDVEIIATPPGMTSEQLRKRILAIEGAPNIGDSRSAARGSRASAVVVP